MCGLVGIVANHPVNQEIYDALTVLQHRGQDSSGIMTDDNGVLCLRKSNGLVSDVFSQEDMATLRGNIGIGHVRWATHGVPNDVNSHPHYSNSGRLVIIHNGIIENYEPLKKELISRGYTFQSDTDTEVLINLIEEVQKTENLKLGK